MRRQGVWVGTRVAVAVEILAVITAGGLVPLLLDVRDGPQLVRGPQVPPDLRVVAEMRLDVGVDDSLANFAHAVGHTCPSVMSTSYVRTRLRGSARLTPVVMSNSH